MVMLLKTAVYLVHGLCKLASLSCWLGGHLNVASCCTTTACYHVVGCLVIAFCICMTRSSVKNNHDSMA